MRVIREACVIHARSISAMRDSSVLCVNSVLGCPKLFSRMSYARSMRAVRSSCAILTWSIRESYVSLALLMRGIYADF